MQRNLLDDKEDIAGDNELEVVDNRYMLPRLNDGTRKYNQYLKLKEQYIELRDGVISEAGGKFPSGLQEGIKEFKSQTDSFLTKLDVFYKKGEKVAGRILEESDTFNNVLSMAVSNLEDMVKILKNPDGCHVAEVRDSLKLHASGLETILDHTFNNIHSLADNLNMLGRSPGIRH